MLTRLFTRVPVRRVIQARNASNFNKYPVYKVNFCGFSGNAWLVIGTVSLIVSSYTAQKAGGLFPMSTPGWGGIFTAKGIPMDLTPDALKNKSE